MRLRILVFLGNVLGASVEYRDGRLDDPYRNASVALRLQCVEEALLSRLAGIEPGPDARKRDALKLFYTPVTFCPDL